MGKEIIFGETFFAERSRNKAWKQKKRSKRKGAKEKEQKKRSKRTGVREQE
jgi:hypothetical protein